MPALLVDSEELRFKLLLFDLDGTLIDDADRYKNLAALRFEALIMMAGRVAAETWAPLGGYNWKTKIIDMNGAIGKASRREDMAIAAAAIYTTGRSWHDARKLAEQAYSDADVIQMKNYTPRLFSGTEEVLRRVKDVGFSLGVATNGPSAITDELLGILNIRELFGVIAGSDEAPNPKPAPDLLQMACRKAGVSPSEAVYVGDQPVDAEAAEAAGFLASIIVGSANVGSFRGVHRLSAVADLVASV